MERILQQCHLYNRCNVLQKNQIHISEAALISFTEFYTEEMYLNLTQSN